MRLLSLAFILIAGAVCIAPSAWAKKGRLSPAKIKQIKKTNKSFKDCRREALGEMKDGKISKKNFANSLKACNERFPGASLYVICKKRAISQAKSKNINPDQAIKSCKRFLVAASFDPKEPVPFFVYQGALYFAGIGLNKTMPASNLDLPNFGCEKVTSLIKNPKEAQYFLFGNHPRIFDGLEGLKGKKLAKALKFKKPRPNGFDVPGFGRLYGKPTNSSGVVFFPTGSCDFDAQLGSYFSGLSAYYLMDGASSNVTPYFGIAYFKKDAKVTTAQIIKTTRGDLGPSFKTFTKNTNVTFVAATDVSETDAEQDPKNLCKRPRKHQIVAVVQGKKDNPKQPEYLILANIKNLCDYGDRLAKRISK